MKPHPHRRRSFCAAVCPLLLGLLLIPSAARAGTFAVPALPVINTNNIVNILNFGAVGDAVTTNTTAIQNAINAASAGGVTNGASGGTVEFPAGVFMCGPLTLKSHVNLQLDGGCFLRMLAFTNYPKILSTNVTTSFTTNTTTMVITTNFTTNVLFTAQNFLSGSGLTDLEISGPGWIQGQGEPWWPFASVTGDTRPIMISLSGCNRTLVQSVTLSNSPEFHIAFGGKNGNTTVQFVTIRANPSEDPLNPGHNTDACDVSGTNILVQFNNISVGDDDYTCGGGTSGMLISNNVYGNGHGVSIGSFTSPSVSNMTVVNCTFTNTDAGLRIKTDRDRGGYVHDILYGNLTMTNMVNPILIYTEYTNTTSMYRAVDSISPAIAASYPTSSISSTTPYYRNILISNLVANAKSTRAAGLLWGLPESSISNVTLINVHLAGSKTFGMYDVKNIQIIDSSHNVPVGISQFSFYNADVTFSNSVPSSSVVTLDGVTTNARPNRFTFYNALMTLKNTNAIALNSSVSLGASTFIISNNLTLTASNTLSFVLGSSPATIVVKGNLATGGTNNILAGPGFANGTYTLFTYTGTLSGPLPTLAAQPAGHVYTYDTSIPGQVNIIIGPLAPGIPANLTAVATNLLVNLQWFAAADAVSYNLKRSTNNGVTYSLLANLTATNYSDSAVNPGTTYTYIVSATNSTAESANSVPASAIPLPSLAPTPLQVQTGGNQLQLSWPADHLGWRLQIQTNDPDTGLGTNWTDWVGSTNILQTNINIDPANAGVFLRLVYP